MSATEHMRAMLDGLMGTARDGSDSQRQHLHFSNSRICRAFLLDCCPHDIFVSTKLELGECPQVHDFAVKADFKNANIKPADRLNYENSALDRLQNFINDADKKTENLKRQLAEAQKELSIEDAKPAASHQPQNLRVCDICSAYLGVNDNESRLADHFGGKLHLGFIEVREKLEDLKKIVSEKRGSLRRGGRDDSRSRTVEKERIPDRPSRDHERERDYHGRSRDYYRGERDYERDRERDYLDRDYDRDRGREARYRERERDRSRSGSRYHERDRERERSRSSSRYYRPREHVEPRYHSRGEQTPYQSRLREWEKREADKAKRYAIRQREEQDRKQLIEQESRKLKEFLEDYKDDRDDIRYYRGSALARRLADRRKELEQDELSRQKEKMELEILSRSCAVENSSPQPIERANGIDSNSLSDDTNKAAENPPASEETSTINILPTSKPSTTVQNKGSTSEDKRKLVEELIGSIPTDKDQLFAKELDWSLLDENLMEKRIRPWVTKKIAEYMGEKEVDLIDFVCTLLNNHTDGSSMLREVAIVLDDEAEKFVVHMWRLLIFELEAKKIGLRK